MYRCFLEEVVVRSVHLKHYLQKMKKAQELVLVLHLMSLKLGGLILFEITTKQYTCNYVMENLASR